MATARPASIARSARQPMRSRANRRAPRWSNHRTLPISDRAQTRHLATSPRPTSSIQEHSNSHQRVVRSPSARDAARPRRSASRDCTGRVADMSKVGVRPVCPDVFGPPRNRSTDATRGHRLPSADPGGSLRDAAGDPDPLGPELQRSVARDKVDPPTFANGRAMEAWRIFAAPGGGRSPPRPTQIILRKLRACD
jgi:hypothetical protein